jgi:hypothetical protein
VSHNAIGHGGQPTRVFRAVAPPRTALVDLATLSPMNPINKGAATPSGLRMHRVVEDTLACWGRCEQGADLHGRLLRDRGRCAIMPCGTPVGLAFLMPLALA